MPIVGLEGPEREQEQRREHSDQQMQRRQEQRDIHRGGRDSGLRGTIMELSGPEHAPYETNDWDGLGKRRVPSSADAAKAVAAKAAAKAKIASAQKTAAAKKTSTQSPTQVVNATLKTQNWQVQLNSWVNKLKAMLGMK